MNARDGICLLGATGFIGSSIAAALTREGIGWVGLTRNSPDAERLRRVSYADVEGIDAIIRRYPLVINATGSLKPNVFVKDHDAAMAAFQRYLGELERLFSCTSLTRLIHVSSAGTVYGEAGDRPNHEDDAPRPKSWYGRTKVVEEESFSRLCENRDIPFTCVRLGNPFGNSRAARHGFVDVLLNSVRENKTFTAAIDQNTCRHFIHAPEMARRVVALACDDTCGTFNIASERPTRLMDILEYVRKAAPGADIRFAPAISNHDVINSHVSIEKLKQHFRIAQMGGPDVFRYIEDALESILPKSVLN